MPDDITLTRELISRGYHPSEVARMTRDGSLVRIRRGAYGDPLDDQAGARARHLRLVRATVRLCAPDAVISHMSAAAVHDLPLWEEQLERVQLSRDQRGGGRRRRFLELHGVRLPVGDVVEVDGLAVTSIPRTVLDLSCKLTMRQAVPVGDAALRGGIASAELEEQLSRAAGRVGVHAARRAIAFLDGRSESPGESVSRVALHELGIAPTELQYEVLDEAGRFVGRSDFAWPEHKTLGEYDGRGKYNELRRGDQSSADVLWAEKEREDRLRDLGWQITSPVQAAPCRWVCALSSRRRSAESAQLFREGAEVGSRREDGTISL